VDFIYTVLGQTPYYRGDTAEIFDKLENSYNDYEIY